MKQTKENAAGPDVGEVKTLCRDCCFAVYEEQTQTDCKLNKIEKFRERGCLVTPAYDKTGKEFFIIEDRFCVFWRGLDWVESADSKIPKDRRSDEDLATRVRHDVRAKFLSIIYLDKDSDLAGAKKTVNSIKSGILTPTKIVICNNHSNIDVKDVIKLARGSGCRWGIEKIAEKGASKQRCVDIAMKKIKSMENTYYSFFSAGYQVPKNFHSDIDNAINDELMSFLALYPEYKSDVGEVADGFVGQIHIHKQIGGNFEKPFLEKIKDTTESQECPHLVKPLSTIVKSQ